MVRNGNVVIPRMPVGCSHDLRGFHAIGTEGMHVHVALVGPQGEEIILKGVEKELFAAYVCPGPAAVLGNRFVCHKNGIALLVLKRIPEDNTAIHRRDSEHRVPGMVYVQCALISRNDVDIVGIQIKPDMPAHGADVYFGLAVAGNDFGVHIIVIQVFILNRECHGDPPVSVSVPVS